MIPIPSIVLDCKAQDFHSDNEEVCQQPYTAHIDQPLEASSSKYQKVRESFCQEMTAIYEQVTKTYGLMQHESDHQELTAHYGRVDSFELPAIQLPLMVEIPVNAEGTDPDRCGWYIIRTCINCLYMPKLKFLYAACVCVSNTVLVILSMV